MRKIEFHCNPVEGSTGFYREIPVMKVGNFWVIFLRYDPTQIPVTDSKGYLLLA